MDKTKNTGVGPIMIGLLLIVIVAATYIIVPKLSRTTVNLQLGNGIFRADVALTDTERADVLSATDSNPARALIKIFPSEEKWKIKISSFKTNTDVVLLSKVKMVVFIIKDASSKLLGVDEYIPRVPAEYIIELPSGSVDSKSINIGDTAIFTVDESRVR